MSVSVMMGQGLYLCMSSSMLGMWQSHLLSMST